MPDLRHRRSVSSELADFELALLDLLARYREGGASVTVEIWGMIGAGAIALIAGLFLVRARFAEASGPGKILVLGPVFEAVALAIFAAEHFLAARDLAPIVPHWIPGALFWTYFGGAALLPLPSVSSPRDMCAGRHPCLHCCF